MEGSAKAKSHPDARGSVADEEEGDLPLEEGMPVESEDGEALGTLASVLVDDETEEVAFFTLATAEGERLVPFEAVLGVEDGTLVLDATKEQVDDLPKARPDRDPTDAEIDLAYRALGYDVEAD